MRSGPGAARTILLFHIISARPSKQPLMVRTFLKVYMELGSYFLFLQEQIKDIIITACLVFIDAWMMRLHELDSVCGLLLTQPLKQRCVESTGGFLWFEDSAWSFGLTSEVVSSVIGICIPVMVLRAVIFYVMCAVSVMCLKFTNVRDAERRNYTSMIPHASMHVFYVHL